MLPEDAEKLEKLSKEKLFELVHISMDIKVENLSKILMSGPFASQQDQAITMLGMTAENEDAFFEKTGVELGDYSF
jgi:hypothetical protein